MKNSTAIRWATISLMGIAAPSVAQVIPVHVQTQVISSVPSAIQVNAYIQNSGTDTLRNLTYVWYLDWTDHGSQLVPELDYATVPGVQMSAVQRPDYIAEARYSLGSNVLLPGQTIQLNTRLHMKDWSNFNVGNDWSFIGQKTGQTADNHNVSIFSGTNRLWGNHEERVGPPLAPPQVQVRTIQTSVSGSALGMDVHVVNTGTVPVTNVVVRWVGSTLGRTSPAVPALDYSTADSAKVRALPVDGTRAEVAMDLGPTFIGVGLEKLLQVRLHSSDWSNVDWTQDWSYPGISATTYNSRVEVELKGYPASGTANEVDTDHDGWSDLLELALGTDPNNAASHPSGATMTGGVIQDTTVSHLVTYNASSLPGYSTRSAIPLTVNPGEVLGPAPRISLAPAGSAPPPIFHGALIVGKVLEVDGAVQPGHTITMPIPLPDKLAATSTRSIQVVHYVNGNWQAERVDTILNGAAYTVLSSFSPIAVGIVQQVNVLAASAGGGHALWVRQGRPWSAGANDRGQLGIRTTAPTPQTGFGPVYWPNSVNVVAVSAGGRHSLAVDANGNVWAWGDNQRGQCGQTITGDSTKDLYLQPVLAVDASADPTRAVVQISAGDSTSYAVTVSGQVLSWGANARQQLGHGSASSSVTSDPVPQPVVQIVGAATVPLDSVYQVAGGQRHAIALRVSGVCGWGANTEWQLDSLVDYTNKPYAVQVPFLLTRYGADTMWYTTGVQGGSSGYIVRPWYAPPSQISAGGNMSYAKLIRTFSQDQGALNMVWGANDSSQIVSGTNPIKMPVTVNGQGRSSISLGRSHLVMNYDNGYTYWPPAGTVLHVYPVIAKGANGAGQSDPTSVGSTVTAWKEVLRPGAFNHMISSGVAAGSNFSMSYDYGADSIYAWGGVWGAVHSLAKSDGSFLEITSPKEGDTLPNTLTSVPAAWRLWQKDGSNTMGTTTAPILCSDSNHCAITVIQSGDTATVHVLQRTLGIATPMAKLFDRRLGQQLGFLIRVPYSADSVKFLLWALQNPKMVLFIAPVGAMTKGNFGLTPQAWYDTAGHTVSIPDGSYGVSTILHYAARPVGWDTLVSTRVDSLSSWVWGTQTTRGIPFGGPDSFQVTLPGPGILQGFLRRDVAELPGVRMPGAWDLRDSGTQVAAAWNLSDSLQRPVYDTLPYSFVGWYFRAVANGVHLIGGSCFDWVGTNSYQVNQFLSEMSLQRLTFQQSCGTQLSFRNVASFSFANNFTGTGGASVDALVNLGLPGPSGSGLQGTWGLYLQTSPSGYAEQAKNRTLQVVK
jgi:hypothetical protein